MELRCDNILHGVLNDGLLEVKCRSRFCGAGPGVVVIHKFDPETGELVRTNRYKDTPIINRKEQGDAVGHRASVRAG